MVNDAQKVFMKVMIDASPQLKDQYLQCKLFYYSQAFGERMP